MTIENHAIILTTIIPSQVLSTIQLLSNYFIPTFLEEVIINSKSEETRLFRISVPENEAIRSKNIISCKKSAEFLNENTLMYHD
jgi:hypothetical protein